MIDWIELIGYAAACLTTCSFVPQAWLTFRSRDVRGISLAMYSAFAAGVALWLAYGWLLGAWPIVLANAITLTLALLILGMKLRYRQQAALSPAVAHPAVDMVAEQPVALGRGIDGISEQVLARIDGGAVDHPQGRQRTQG